MAITISGENNNDRITAQDGVIDTISGFNIAGIITASSFTGDLTGDVTGDLTGNVTGNVNNTSNLLLQVGGTERLRLNSDRVIIGQTLSNNQPTYNTSTTFVTTHTNNPGAWNAIAIISGHTTGASFLKFGDKDSEAVAQIGHYNVDNSLRFFTNGTNERLRITSGGSVGIGLTNPEIFHAQARTLVLQEDGHCGLTIDATSGTNSSIFFADGADGSEAYRGYVQYTHNDGSSSDYLTFGTAAAERLRIKSDGNVGIGTNNPISPFTVSDGSQGFEVHPNSSSTVRLLAYDRTNSVRKNLRIDAFAYEIQCNNGSERLRITNGGQVNIGSANGVLTQTTFKAQIETATNKLISFGAAEGSAYSNQGAAIIFSRPSDGASKINAIFQHTDQSLGIAARDNFTISTGGNAFYYSTSERLRIDSNGDMALGGAPITSGYKSFTIHEPGTGSGSHVRFNMTTGNTGNTSSDGFSITVNATTGNIHYIQREDADMVFQNTNGEKLRITSAGVLQVGSGGNLEMSSNGRIFVGNGGNATNPMFANVSDTNTGIAFPAADTMMFTTGGTERLRITSDGQLNLGSRTAIAAADSTTTPTHFRISRSDNAGAPLITMGAHEYAQSSSAPGAVISSNHRDFIITKFHPDFTGNSPGFWLKGNEIRMYSGSSETLRLSSNSRVGINETSPENQLHISGTTGSSAGGLLRLDATTGDNFIIFDNTGDNSEWVTGIDAGSNDEFRMYYNSGSGYGQEIINIDGTTNNGVVTIDGGTNTLVKIRADSAGTAGLRLGGQSGSGTDQCTGYVEVHQDESHGGGFFYNGDASPTFANYEGADYFSLFRFSSGSRYSVMRWFHNSNDCEVQGNMTIDNGYTGSSSTLLRVRGDSAGTAGISCGGSGSSDNQTQCTGYLECHQDQIHGGGISYNGDGSPGFVNNESADHITYFRMNNGTRERVFHYAYNSNAVNFRGGISASSKSFRITHPHPSKKDTHDLVHSSIEGPQADNIYRGKVDLVGGTATVNIDTTSNMTDGTFVLLNRDIQCFTSNETGWTAVKGSVSGNLLTITAQDNSCTDTISWMVVGERQDDNIKSSDVDTTDADGKLIVELLKEA